MIQAIISLGGVIGGLALFIRAAKVESLQVARIDGTRARTRLALRAIILSSVGLGLFGTAGLSLFVSLRGEHIEPIVYVITAVAGLAGGAIQGARASVWVGAAGAAGRALAAPGGAPPALPIEPPSVPSRRTALRLALWSATALAVTAAISGTGKVPAVVSLPIAAICALVLAVAAFRLIRHRR